MRRTFLFAFCLAIAIGSNACAQSAGAKPALTPSADTTKRADRDGLVPAGFGTLKQEQIAIRLQTLGLTVQVLPLDESVIRTLAPDSYGTLHAIRESKKAALEAVRVRAGLPAVQAWYVTFFNVQQGEARFDAFDVVIRSVGQDFRPIDALSILPGFGEGRVAQGRSVSAVYAFDPQINLNQPLTITSLSQVSTVWADNVLPLVDRERSLIWSRASAAKP